MIHFTVHTWQLIMAPANNRHQHGTGQSTAQLATRSLNDGPAEAPDGEATL